MFADIKDLSTAGLSASEIARRLAGRKPGPGDVVCVEP
jgi:hypothetical protein